MTNQETLNANVSDVGIERWLARTLAVIAISAGWFVPEFYDWTGADQSRPAPVVSWIALGILIADGLLFLLLARLHFSRRVHSQETSKRWNFSVLHILMSMTCVAVFLMLARLTSMQIACRLLQAVVLSIGIWIAVRFPWTRFRIAWIALLQFAPFLWVFRQMGVFSNTAGLLVFFTSLPTLLPAAFFVQANREDQWLLTLLTTTEFAICVWLSYLGPKRTLAGGIFVLTLSVFSSFVLNALMRM